MTPKEEKAYERGAKAFARRILFECQRELGGTEATKAAHVAYVADVRAALRIVCDDFGDNDWEDNLHLADVVEKHLRRHLVEERERRLKAERLLRRLHKELHDFIRELATGKLGETGARRTDCCLREVQAFLSEIGEEDPAE